MPKVLISTIAAFGLSGLLMGCVQVDHRLNPASRPEGVPVIEEILRDLGSNDQAIETFRAAGSFTLSSPKLTADQRFPRGHVKFRRPDQLYVQGRHRILNTVLFKLTCVGEAYLMEFPTSAEDSFYQLEGDDYEDVPFSVSPSEIAREMFLPEAWLELPRREVRLLQFDEVGRHARLEIGPRNQPRRRVDVALVGENPPAWVVVRNIRLDENGVQLSVTTLSDYEEIDQIRFPGRIDAYFPTEDTRMTFTMRNIRPNYLLTDADFNLEGRARELGLLSESAP